MPRTNKRYKNMTRRTRDKIEALYNAKVPVKTIAEELGYSFQAIYTELHRGFYMHRNHDWTETKKYSADKAQLVADFCMSAKGAPLKLDKDKEFAEFVEDMVLKGYSPGAILLYVKEHGLNFKTKVCRVTLYSYIDKGIFLKISNKNLLHKGERKKKSAQEKQAKKLPNLEHCIERRPEEVSERNTFGHWEGDSVIGTNKKGETLFTLTERLTRLELILKSKDKTAGSIVRLLNRLERCIGSVTFRKVFKTITFDNGTEFSDTKGIEFSPYTKKRRTRVFYCHPYCSSERGSNENQNGFIRRFIPKGTAISNYSEAYIQQVQDFINSYPRGIFNGENSLKRFQKELCKLNIKNFLPKIQKIS
ncbi:MAG: IS30 family transposase [Ruminococcaceae bacterium]|nr:IS30 family transposase [Oscillospiraceae bacterium]